MKDHSLSQPGTIMTKLKYADKVPYEHIYPTKLGARHAAGVKKFRFIQIKDRAVNVLTSIEIAGWECILKLNTIRSHYWNNVNYWNDYFSRGKKEFLKPTTMQIMTTIERVSRVVKFMWKNTFMHVSVSVAFCSKIKFCYFEVFLRGGVFEVFFVHIEYMYLVIFRCVIYIIFKNDKITCIHNGIIDLLIINLLLTISSIEASFLR